MAKNRPPIKPASRAEFRKAMEEFAAEVNGDLKIVELEQARLMMRDAMTFSAPMPKGGGRGLSIAAQKAGKNKLGNDVRRIFIPMDKPRKALPVILRRVVNSVRGNDQEGFRAIYDNANTRKLSGLSPVMRKIMQDTSYTRAFAKAKNYLSHANIFGNMKKIEGPTTDFRDIHDRAKGAVGGRWPKNQPYNGPQYFAPAETALAAYITSRQQKVGWVKAGYADALSKIPMPKTKAGVPRNFGAYNAPWVDANRAGYGYFSSTSTKGSVSGVVGNAIGNINDVADEADVKNIVYGLRVANLQKAVQAHMQATANKQNRRRK